MTISWDIFFTKRLQNSSLLGAALAGGGGSGSSDPHPQPGLLMGLVQIRRVLCVGGRYPPPPLHRKLFELNLFVMPLSWALRALEHNKQIQSNVLTHYENCRLISDKYTLQTEQTPVASAHAQRTGIQVVLFYLELTWSADGCLAVTPCFKSSASG